MTSGTGSLQERLKELSASKTRLLQVLVEQGKSSQRRAIEAQPRVVGESGAFRCPTSWAQQRLWFIDQLEGGSAAYNVPIALRLRGNLCQESLRAAFHALIRRHESLRTVFVTVAGEPVQEIHPESRFEMTVSDLSAASGEEQEQRVLEYRNADGQQRFDLENGPLMRARLLRLSAEEHVLLIVMHHIVSDGWSLGVMMPELAELYSARSERRRDSLAPLRIQYADYAQWQRGWLQGPVLDRQLSFWLSHLDGAPPQLDLPLDRPRPAVQAYRGENLLLAMTPELSAALQAFARRNGMTLFMVLTAAWAILLSRLAGQSDVVIGTPIANRRHAELEGLVGFFVNTLALRVQVDRQQPLLEFLQRVKAMTLAAYEHQDIPFEQLVEALKPARARNRHPIFQSLFVLQNAPIGAPDFRGLDVSREDEINNTSKFDVVLMLEERGERIAGLLNYDTDLFDRTTVQRWMDSFMTLLEALTADACATVADLLPMSSSERACLAKFNATDADYRRDVCIHDLFQQQAAATPEVIAVTHNGDSLTYAELNTRADRLAALLKARGISADQPVGLCVQRSPDMAIGLLAILKAGGAYLPLDPHYPPDRLQYMLDDGTPPVVLTQARLAPVLPKTYAEVIVIDELSAAELSTNERPSTKSETTPQNLLYVIYTSGSTGKPKGTAMPHRAMVNLIEWHRACLPLSAGERVLQFAALSFDVAFQEVFSTLCLGGTLVMLDETVRRDARALTELLTKEGVQRLFIPPLMLQSLAEHFHASGEVPRSLTDVITAGEQLRVSAEIVGLFEALPRCRLHNHYGPTETHVVTALTLAGPPSSWPEFPSIGQPVANTQIRIVDDRWQPVPIGVAGEIYIAGANVARGYLRREELTSQRFVRDIFSAMDDARMYKTGDLGRWRADGTIEYLGRNDDQVKIRGYRIELGEIETQIARHPQVKEVAVVAREDSPGVKRLIAYFTQRDLTAVGVDELRAQLKKALPEYMVPSAFVRLDEFPLTPSGKLNRRALPAPALDAFSAQHYEAPANDIEKAIAGIWQRLLRVERAGRDDSFFDLGGHSLLVLKALYEIEREFGQVLRVSDIYQNATVRELALRLAGTHESQRLVKLSCEATLDAEIVPIGTPKVPAEGILITGVTGFVGRFVLAQLLRETNAVLYCLVRAQSSIAARRRIIVMLAQWDLWQDEFEHRIVAVPGDLRQAKLGIDERSWRELRRNVDSIFHCGTSMNHLEPYAMAKAANVGSVRELLRLAVSERPKQLNCISTLGIFNSSAPGLQRIVDESSSIDDERHPDGHGYGASKWVGEKIALLAMERGIPCNIFRLGLVWADSLHGRYDERQRVYRVFKSSLLTGMGIQHYERYETPPMPVDDVARAITSLASRHGEGQNVFHICSPSDRSNGWFECCNASGRTSLELLPFYEWTRCMKRLHESGVSLPVIPLIEGTFDMDEATFYEHFRSFHAGLTIESKQTGEALARVGAVASSLNPELIEIYLETMLATDPDLEHARQARRRGGSATGRCGLT